MSSHTQKLDYDIMSLPINLKRVWSSRISMYGSIVPGPAPNIIRHDTLEKLHHRHTRNQGPNVKYRMIESPAEMGFFLVWDR